MAAAAKQQPTIYQLKVTLHNIRPPIWRRLLVPRDMTLDALHDVLQTAFGWMDEHLHQFVVGDKFYGVPHPDYRDLGPPMKDECQARLGYIIGGGARKLLYEYDFGDGWEHEIVVEKKLAPEAGLAYPRCSGGRRAGPPEDCGGPWGYAELLEKIADPEHPEHEEMREWHGDFDAETFDLEAVNARLERRLGRG